MISQEIRDALFALRDEGYRDFQAKLIPGVEDSRIIGVRMPELRKLSGRLARRQDAEEFLKELPHGYYEEDNLHGIWISECRDYQRTIAWLEEFLPYVDNWATCDLLRPKSFQKNRKRLEGEIERWLCSERTYTIRFGIEMIMTHFLDEDFAPKWLHRVSLIHSEAYYVNMMLAWFHATALAKQWDAAIPYLLTPTFDRWVHNKTIQKALESYRITDEQKGFLRGLKMV